MQQIMKAAVARQYGSPEVVRLEDAPVPALTPHDILVQVAATDVSIADSRLRRADPFAARFFFGLFRPRLPILGACFSGRVAAVGAQVTAFKIGDTIMGSTGLRMGAHAQFVCLPESGAVMHMPENINHEQAAAAIFGGFTAWYFLQKANIQAGQKVLVYGASGAVGSAAVQIAKYLGAEVTAVCSTTRRDAMLRIGADKVIDYTREDFSKSGEAYDVIFETVGKTLFSACVAALTPNGKLILGAAMLPAMLRGLWHSCTSKQKVIIGMAAETPELLAFLHKRLAEGHLNPLIDEVFTPENIVEANRRVDSGRKLGSVLVRWS